MIKLHRIFILSLIFSFTFSIATAAKNEIFDNELTPIETITEEMMMQHLQHQNTDTDILYVKLNATDIEIYQNLAQNRSFRKQLILKMPNTEIIRLYTINKAVFLQMNKMLSDYENNGVIFNGYKLITDQDLPVILDNGQKLYRFWFMKLKKEKASRHHHFPIGIGIGIGGRHHPWIGIDW